MLTYFLKSARGILNRPPPPVVETCRQIDEPPIQRVNAGEGLDSEFLYSVERLSGHWRLRTPQARHGTPVRRQDEPGNGRASEPRRGVRHVLGHASASAGRSYDSPNRLVRKALVFKRIRQKAIILWSYGN